MLSAEDSYDAFRAYLDETYSVKKEEGVHGLSVGYPTARDLELPISALRLLSPFDGDKVLQRPGYGWEAGSLDLRKALLDFENVRFGTQYSLANIAVCAGATYAMNRICERIFTPNEAGTLLVLAPTFYRMLGRQISLGRVRTVNGREEDGFLPSPVDVAARIDSTTRAIFMVNPSNPMFTYYPRNWFDDLVTLCEARGIFLIVDESGDVFPRGDYGQYSSLTMQSPRLVRIVTASKKHFLAEYRLGYIIAPRDFLGSKTEGLLRDLGDDMGNPPLAANSAWQELVAHETFRLSESRCVCGDCDYDAVSLRNSRWIDDRWAEVEEFLKKHSSRVSFLQPQCNYNVLVRFSGGTTNGTDLDIMRTLLTRFNLSLCPGAGFGLPPDDRYFRLTYAINPKELYSGLGRLSAFLSTGGA